MTDIKSIGTGSCLNMADYYSRLSDLLTFEKKKGETNADLVARILTSAKRFKSEDKIPVSVVEFLGLNLNTSFPVSLNLNKPVHVLYYGKKKQYQ